MAGLLENLQSLNQVDLSKLKKRLDVLRTQMEKDLALKGLSANSAVTTAEIKNAADKSGITVEDLMNALETAKRMGST